MYKTFLKRVFEHTLVKIGKFSGFSNVQINERLYRYVYHLRDK